jgi:hypothetical protein
MGDINSDVVAISDRVPVCVSLAPRSFAGDYAKPSRPPLKKTAGHEVPAMESDALVDYQL